MSIKRGVSDHRDLLLVLITAAVALGGIYQYSQSINETPQTNYVLVEYTNELPAGGSQSLTGNLVTEQPPLAVKRLMDETPSEYRFRTKYGCYQRCTCSYADTCQCFYGGCFTVGNEPEKIPTPTKEYTSVGEHRINSMVLPGNRRYYGPDQ